MGKKWRFVSNQNSEIVGINDAGIETFTANLTRSLVREIIQNSLDAAIDDCKDPVEVEFYKFDISRDGIPDVENFENDIKKCKMSNHDEPNAYNFFDKAQKILNQAKISVLRISDYRTKGLEGADTCKKGTSWSRLVKESGSSNKGKGSGGSFGIGKAAAFAYSDLRTVFYSSKDIKGIVSNFGVAKLVSFEDEELGWTTGIGYYSEDDKFVAIPEFANFDKNHIRTVPGTDIYILGMHEQSDFIKDFIKAVLLDFLVSLINDKLIVRIQNEVINAKSLSKYMNTLNPYESTEIKELLEYYHVLTSHDPRIKIIKLDSNKYGKKFGFQDGEATLYLEEGEGLNRKILVTRRAGMRILELNHISGSIDFTGIFVIEGDKMNEVFKRMEVPSHDAWEPGRVRGDEKKYTKILKELKTYLRNTVKESFGTINTNSMDALGANDFLPDEPNNKEDNKIDRDEMSVNIKSLEEKIVRPTMGNTRNVDEYNAEMSSEPGDDMGSGKGIEPGPEPVPGPPHPGPGIGISPGNNGGLDASEGKAKAMKKISVKERLMVKDANQGIYFFKMYIPSTSSEARLEFFLSGEQTDVKLPIINAKIMNSNAKIKSISRNKIFLTGLKKAEKLSIELQVDFEGYCRMGVEYYASKR